MAQNYSNLTGGLRVQTQIPLNVKANAVNEAVLANLGLDDNLAFTYEQGLIVYCAEEGTRWEWREVIDEDETGGLLPVHFQYPSDLPSVNGINYSSKQFNFFLSLINGTNGTDGEDGEDGTAATIAVGTVTTGTPGSSAAITNAGTSSTAVFNFTIPRGDVGATGPTADNLQKTITYPGDFTGTNYTVVNGDNNYTILVNNGATAVTITIPSGLVNKINVGFFKQGSANVTFVGSGTTINSPEGMLKFRVQNSNAYFEQVGTSNVYQLCGDLKS